MRREIGVTSIGALLLVLVPRICSAASPSLTIPSFDLRAQVAMRLFGEISDAKANLAATRGDRSGESLLRENALCVRVVAIARPFVTVDVASDFPIEAYSASSSPFASEIRALPPLSSHAAFVAPSVPDLTRHFASPPASVAAPLAAAYRGAEATPSAPSSSRFELVQRLGNGSSLVTFSPVLSPVNGFDAASPAGAGLSLPSVQATVHVPLRVGKYEFEGHVGGAQAQAPDLALQDTAYSAGATFGLRAGQRRVDLDVASGYEHLTRDDSAFSSSSFDSTSNWEVSNTNLPVLVPSYADVGKRTLSAGLDVPVTRDVTLNVRYDTQHLLGGYGVAGATNLDARNDVYGGKLTFAIPHTSGALSLTAKQYRYQDNIIPTNTYTQTSAGVNFTIKF